MKLVSIFMAAIAALLVIAFIVMVIQMAEAVVRKRRLARADSLELRDMFEELGIDDSLVLFNNEASAAYFGVRIINSNGEFELRRCVTFVRGPKEVISYIEVMSGLGRSSSRRLPSPMETGVFALYYRQCFVGFTGQPGLDVIYRAFRGLGK